MAVGDTLETVPSNSRRTNASSVHMVGGSGGFPGALEAKGDRIALRTVDTMPDLFLAGVGTVTVAADVGSAVLLVMLNEAAGVGEVGAGTASAATLLATSDRGADSETDVPVTLVDDSLELNDIADSPELPPAARAADLLPDTVEAAESFPLPLEAARVLGVSVTGRLGGAPPLAGATAG